MTLVKIIERTVEYAYDSLFRLVRAELQFRRSDGRLSEPVTRINFDRGDSVGVLLYDPDDDTVVLVHQFRYPVYESLAPEEQTGERARQAWLLEIVAGSLEDDRAVREVAHAELIEEAGYRVGGELQRITTIYPSPGGTSERIHLFLATVDRRQVTDGGGLAAEGEDIEVVALPFPEALAMIDGGEIQDAKTVVALQHLALMDVTRIET